MPDIAGLKLIVPTSVAGSGVSVSASGKVTFTSATTVSINGCFTSTYDNYLIVGSSKSLTGLANLYYRLRLSGTDASGSNYTTQVLDADSTTVSAARVTETNGRFGVQVDSPAINSGWHLYLYGPALAQPTASRGVCGSAGGNARIRDDASTHSLSTAYDGISLFASTGTLTGALTVYGLSQ